MEQQSLIMIKFAGAQGKKLNPNELYRLSFKTLKPTYNPCMCPQSKLYILLKLTML